MGMLKMVAATLIPPSQVFRAAVVTPRMDGFSAAQNM
jgi:hypothetical protein